MGRLILCGAFFTVFFATGFAFAEDAQRESSLALTKVNEAALSRFSSQFGNTFMLLCRGRKSNGKAGKVNFDYGPNNYRINGGYITFGPGYGTDAKTTSRQGNCFCIATP